MPCHLTHAADFGALADSGWPALERLRVPDGSAASGWMARFSGGVTRRANSVRPLHPVGDVDAAIRLVERLYREPGLAPQFQLSDRDAALRDTLQARGYVASDETLVMAAPARTVVAEAAVDGTSAGMAVSPDEDWLRAWWEVDGRGGAAERMIAHRILEGAPALYATVRDSRGPASVGRLALVDHAGTTWGGLHALATRADARGRGHATAAIAALVRAGVARGAGAVWLQVLASNDTARRLYDGLGFRPVAAYRYLTTPH